MKFYYQNVSQNTFTPLCIQYIMIKQIAQQNRCILHKE